jgi:hypothetical protein
MLAPRDRESIPGDLAEAYEEHVFSRGRWEAHRWYVRQVLGITWHVGPRSPKQNNVSLGLLLGLVMAVGVVVTNVLLPLAHVELVEDPLAEVLQWAVVVTTIVGAGWSRRRAGLGAAVRAGGIVAFHSFGIVMLTFLVVDNVFLDLVSQQPEKQRLLHESGYQSMRVAVTIAQLRALITVLPILSVLGALAGGIGGLLPGARNRR